MVENKFYFKFSLLCFILLFLTGYILFFITNISYASDSVYVWSTETKPLDKTQTTNANLNTSLVNNQTTDLALQSGGAVLIDILQKYEVKEAYAFDINKDLINCYNVIKTNVENLIQELDKKEKDFIQIKFHVLKMLLVWVAHKFGLM